MSQGLFDDVETNVTTVTLLERSPSSPRNAPRPELPRSEPVSKMKNNLVDVFSSTLEAINLQRAAVEDALQVLMLAKLKLGVANPSGTDLINMIRKVSQRLFRQMC